jgi:hypothetical protein
VRRRDVLSFLGVAACTYPLASGPQQPKRIRQIGVLMGLSSSDRGAQVEVATPDGGLLAYAVDTRTLFHRAASYVDRILKGAKPGELPVEQPTHFELSINLQTAKALGLEIPATLIARADEVIG